MSITRNLARTGAALVAIAVIGIGSASSAYAEKPAAKPAKTEKGANQGSTNHSCDGSHHSDTGHGANTDGPTNPYHNTCDEGVASANGKGDGKAKGRPAAGTVGNADDKNPPGQAPGPSDRNNGYECDGNEGIAKGNPAHTGCTAAPAAVAPEVVEPVKVTCPSGEVMTEDVNHDGAVNNADCDKVDEPVVVEPSGFECADGVMAEDVNHDGVITNADCTEVLGETLEKPLARPVVPAAVAGVQLDKRPLAVGGVALPLTGGQARSLFAYAGMLIAAGAVLLTAGRRIGTAA
jgi:LPXTG-motif cell wall-anchored protein